MYLKHFGFEQKPFNITPNPEFMFLSSTHKEVFAHLLYGIQNHSGFIEVTGEVGTGKTTVLRTLFKQLDEEIYRLALIFNPRLNAVELLQSINREFGVNAETTSLSELQNHLNDYLLTENRAGRTVVLVVDEAQNLSPEVLEQIRLLSNLETETDKLIQIILVGQPELDEMLNRSELRQLRQRITVSYRLEVMPGEDALRYIQHRLSVAGQSRQDLFTPDALKLILKRSGGNPRLTNVLCDRCLLVCFSENSSQVSDKHVRQAQRELWQEDGRSLATMGRRLLYAVLFMVPITFLGGYWVSREHLDSQKMVVPPALQVPAPVNMQPQPSPVVDSTASQPKLDATQPAAVQRLPQLRRLLRQSEAATHATVAFDALAELWKIEKISAGKQLLPNQIAHEAGKRGLDAAPYAGSFGELLRFNLPAILDLAVPGDSSRRYLALTGFDSQGFRIEPPLSEIDYLQANELEALWSGRAILLWQNHTDLPYVGNLGHKGKDVINIQQLLAEAGFYRQTPSGVFDEPTLDAVTRFQAESGLVQDGHSGPQTLILLYRAAGYFEVELEAATLKEEGV